MFCKRFHVPKLLSAIVGLLLSISYSSPIFADKEIQTLRVWSSPEGTRVVFDLSEMVNYKIFTLENPHRVVIDIDKAQFKAKWNQANFIDSGITQLRHSSQEKGKLRIVLDLDSQMKPSSFLLTPNDSYGHRLVIDLTLNKPKAQGVMSKAPATTVKSGRLATREFIVAIDPGHGGEDTGAIGRQKHIREKDIVFAVSKKLQQLINSQKGMRAFLVRSGDYYVGLRKRMDLAREQGADLFISVHADSFKDPRATGASVFVLSEKGASNEAARWLAESENRADLVGGISLDDKSNVLASVLLDLSQTASKSASNELATHLIQNLAKITNLHHKTVQHAGFMVLKSPDIPSVLVELGFISNAMGEEKLSNPTHQLALANALLMGVKTFVAKRPPPIKHPEDWTTAKKSVPTKQMHANLQRLEAKKRARG